MRTTALIITIGNELLNGLRLDTNSFWIAKQLDILGINVLKKISIKDDYNSIWSVLENEKFYNLIIITGGLGPTSDDITKPLLAKFFGGTMICHKPSLNNIKKILSKHNRPVLERNLQQAYIPSSCKAFLNHFGTAPGMCFENKKLTLISLPGVPHEMKYLFSTYVIPYINKKYANGHNVSSCLLLFGIGESWVAEKLIDVEKKIPSYISLSYLPSTRFLCLRLTGYSTQKKQLTKEINNIKKQIKSLVQENIVSEEYDNILDEFTNYIKKNKLTIACAESCTGGYIAHLLTSLSGASEFFLGSIVSYSNYVKENILNVPKNIIKKYTAVSEQVALSMHTNLLTNINSDYGLAITGYMDNITAQENINTGQVFICVGNKNLQQVIEIKLNTNSRTENIKQASNVALHYLLKYIKNNKQ